MIRLSTIQQFDRPTSLMASLSRQADALQVQIATGKKLAAPSQDPAGWQQLASLQRAGENDAAYRANIVLAQGLLAQSDTALAGVEEQLQRAQEIALQASTGTITDGQRSLLAASLDAIVDDLLGLANAKDARGQPLFGGAEGDTAYVRDPDGTIRFAGTGEPAAIPIAESASILATDSGARVFGGIATADGTKDVFAIVADLSAALKGSGGEAAASTALADLGAALAQVTSARASVGARGARLELETARLEQVALSRETVRSGIEDVDVPSAIAELQKTLTVLQATQASFTKLSSLNLFDYLR